MTPASAVDAICDALRARGEPPSLVDVGLRSRLGKGPCQGTFCAVRAAAHLCRREDFDATRGMSEIRNFIAERWGNQRAVLWGPQLGQAELAEAIHCGVFGEELLSPADMHAAKVVTP
jgi:glycerol-3-phosphate dehydrogenase